MAGHSTIPLNGVSLLALRHDSASRFYAQTWYDREAFACRTWRGEFPMPTSFLPCAQVPDTDEGLLPAAVLARAFLWGDLPMLDDCYVWTCDLDHRGDRVYVGMAGEYPGLQVHRHLTLDQRWVR